MKESWGVESSQEHHNHVGVLHLSQAGHQEDGEECTRKECLKQHAHLQMVKSRSTIKMVTIVVEALPNTFQPACRLALCQCRGCQLPKFLFKVGSGAIPHLTTQPHTTIPATLGQTAACMEELFPKLYSNQAMSSTSADWLTQTLCCPSPMRLPKMVLRSLDPPATRKDTHSLGT